MFYDRYARNLRASIESGREYHERVRPLLPAFNEAKVFFIDDFIRESLLNSKYTFVKDDPELAKLPFPYMFFEFETGLEYRTLEKEINGEFYISGLLYTPLREDLSINPRTNIITEESWNSKGFSVYALGNLRKTANASGPFHEAHFFYDTGNLLINELCSRLENADHFDTHSVIINIGDKEQQEAFLRELEDKKQIQTPFIEDEYLDAQKMPNLVVNILDYIRAENVVVTPRNRVIRGGGRRPNRNLRPYHLIELKKRVYPEREDSQEGLWEVDCRFWVMGHNHKYHTSNGIVIKWIEPYIKGPVNAPWKNNRYLMLYRNFRQRLARRGNEDIGTSLEDSV